jgi:type VI secretion system secreted protein VgrG
LSEKPTLIGLTKTGKKRDGSGSQLDMRDANRIMREKVEGWKMPEGYTWHHIENSRRLILVPKDLHGIVRHNGGRSTYEF